MKPHYSIIFILLIIIATSCRSGDNSVLVAAESVMDEHPDSALHLLEQVDGVMLTGELRARHALLLSQAYDKNYIDLTSDSLINIAVGFYEKQGSEHYRLMSLYYRATIYYNSGIYDKAVVDATSSYELARKRDDAYWTAKAADRLADLFYLTYNNEECIGFRKIAVSSFADAGDFEAKKWARLSLAIDYSADKDFSRSIRIVDSIVPVECVSAFDSTFKSNCIQSLFHFHVNNGDYEIAKGYFEDMRGNSGYSASAIDYGDMGYAEVMLGNLDKAVEYMDSAYMLADKNNLQEILAADIAFWEYLKKTGSKADVIEFTEKLIGTQNRIAGITVKQSALGAQRDFYNVKAVSAAHEVSQVYKYIIIGIAATCLLIAIIGIIVKLKMRLKDNEIELKMNEIALLSARISEYDRFNEENDNSESGNLRIVIGRLLSEWFRPLNSLFDEYYENGDSATVKATMFARVEKELRKITSKKSTRDIVGLVDDSLNGALTRLHEQLPGISDKDIIFIALNIARLSPRAICLFMDIKIKTVYSKRKRLRDRLAASNLEDKDYFMDNLS